MQKIEGINYPDQVQEMLADNLLGPVFRAFLKKKGLPEKYVFLDAVAKKRDPKPQFKLFFSDSAKHAVNARSEALVTAKKLGKAQDWKSKDWKKVYDLAIEDTVRFVDGEFLEPFFKSDEFMAHHLDRLEKQMLRRNYGALLKELDCADKKGMAKVAAMVKADKKKGPRTVKAFVKKNKIDEKPPTVLKKIKKAFGIK